VPAELSPRILRRHAAELRLALARDVHVHREGDRVYVVVVDVQLPGDRFAIGESDLLIMSDLDYPNSALDMFYLEPEAVRAGGGAPQNADQIESHLGRQWRRFSWHSTTRWNPAGNPLCDHFAFAEQRLALEPLA
jgi:Prokaryotic E2 family E